MRAEGDGEAGEHRHAVGDDRGGDLVHGEAAVVFGDIDRHQAEVAGLFQQAAGHVEVLGFDLVGGGQDFIRGELARRFRRSGAARR